MLKILELVNQMSPYVLLGFFCAGLMHAFIPNSIYKRFLGGNSVRSVFNAALLGIPLPLCSCGVIPTAMSLRKEGASKGATISFLISTPQTGIDSIFATYSIIGLPFALIRPLAALTTAVAGGLLATKLTDDNKEKLQKEHRHTNSTEGGEKSFFQKIKEALRYAFVDMMQDIGKWLVAGLVIAGIITVCVPDEFFAFFAQSSILSMLLVLLLAIPMYLCATGSIPIAVAIMLKGMSPGTALVLLMAGPAVNTASMLIIGKVMGRRTLLVYLGSVIAGALSFGLLIDAFLPREWFTGRIGAVNAHEHHGLPIFSLLCSIALVALLINAFLQRHKHKHHCHDEACSCHKEKTDTATLFKIDGMTCNHCRANVEKAILTVEGVKHTVVSLAEGTADVSGDFDKKEILKAVESIGFGIEELQE